MTNGKLLPRLLPKLLPTMLLAAILLGPSFLAMAHACTGDCDGDRSVRIEELITAVSLALGSATDGCDAADGDGNGEVSIDELVTAVGHALDGCPSDVTQAFVVATDFQTGSFATLRLTDPIEVDPARPQREVHNDAVPRTHGGLVYVVNRFQGDNIQVIDPAADFATTGQCSTGNGSNPYDIELIAPDRAYVTLYDSTELLIVDPSVGFDCEDFVQGSIDLSSLADRDGLPEMDQMARIGDRLYVTIQRLDRDGPFTPAGPGSVAVIDITTDTLIDEIVLSGSNPFAQTKGIPVRDGMLLIPQTGNFGVLDGGIERVDPESGEAQGFFVTEQTLGGDLSDFVIAADDRGYALISHPDFSNTLLSFDPRTGTVTDTLLANVQFISDIELAPDGRLFVADQAFDAPGLRIFADGAEQTTEPIDLGLPPFQIVFLE